MKTYNMKSAEVDKKWVLIDADGLVTGRLAAVIATRLRGKHKPAYTPHMDCGDHVIVINAEKVALTGKKVSEKKYYRHTGYPGGIKETTPERILDGDNQDRVLRMAVQRMLPSGSLGRQQLSNLRIYVGPEHPHEAQQPEVLDVAGMNSKNKRSVA